MIGSRTTSGAGWAVDLSEILVDAGPLIAGFDDTDVWHEECSRLLETLPGPLLVPATIVADLVETDFERMAQLVDQYADFPLGGSDASVVAIAERRSITTILTTDRRHFSAVRPQHVEAFDLLP